jgi:hypothetical protein
LTAVVEFEDGAGGSDAGCCVCVQKVGGSKATLDLRSLVSGLHAQPLPHLSLVTLHNSMFPLGVRLGSPCYVLPALGPSVVDTPAALFCCGMQMVLATGLTPSMQSA